MAKGKVFTFYSYKGGTGRTMAITNIAVLLSKESNFKTLLIDWDLEAPGVHKYLKPYCSCIPDDKDFEAFPGLIDYFLAIRKGLEVIGGQSFSEKQIEQVLCTINIEDYIINTDFKELSFMKAGNFDGSYSKKINEFKWEELFRTSPAIYQKIGERLASVYDFILIDSRTGYTDTSGICTMILPEKLILVFTPNNQSLKGVVDLAKQAARYRSSSYDLRPLKIYPLPSRIEMAEKDLRELWRKGNYLKKIDGYQLIFEELFEEVYGEEKIDFTSYFDEIQIQHEPRFSYGEEIAVANPGFSDRLSMSESYNRFLDKLLSDECIWDYKKFPQNHNLPNPVPLIGREFELQQIKEGLNSRYPVITIEGQAGIGKTIIALQIGYQSIKKAEDDIKSLSFEYVVWISSKNKFDRKRNLNEILDIIAKTMGYTRITQIEDWIKKELEINDLLSKFPVLIIINNLELVNDEKILTWIRNIPAPSKILITARSNDKNTRINQEHVPSWIFKLKGLNDKEAQELVHSRLELLKLPHPELYSNMLTGLKRSLKGNPGILELLIGFLVDNMSRVNEIINILNAKKFEGAFNYLFEETWKYLSNDAKSILLSVPFFVGTFSITKTALCRTSGLSSQKFHKAVDKLFQSALIKPMDTKDRYFAHPITREFGRLKLKEEKDFEEKARIRWSEFYLEFVRSKVVRTRPYDPQDEYWNALVSDKMTGLDSEWSSVLEVLKWADHKDRNELLTKFLMVLIHYMDSRFYNLERMRFVKKAIMAYHDSGSKYEQALLKIDALGWTYVEETRYCDAQKEIDEGMEILEHAEEISPPKKDELKALAYAWKARVQIELGKYEEAEHYLGEAMKFKVNAWITFRIYMIAGDKDLKQNNYGDALENYRLAKKYLNSYGGEGQNYQIDPRIGLSCLQMGKLEEAEKLFEELLKLESIPIGQLFGEYGIALIKFIRGDTDGARRLLRTVKENLNRRTTSNLLLKMIETTELNILKNPTRYQRLNYV